MTYQIYTSNRFNKSLKRCIKRGLNVSKLKEVVTTLANGEQLSSSHRPHKLSGKYANAWECHIEPNWLLIWEQNDTELILLLIDTGTHSDIF